MPQRPDSADIDEYQIIKETAKKLKEYGEATVELITGSMDPSSLRKTPDLVFIPRSGPNKDTVHIIEFKRTNSDLLPSVLVSNARQHSLRLQKENPGVPMRYALSSNSTVSPTGTHAEVIDTLTNIKDAKTLTNRVAEWAGVVMKAEAESTR